MMKSPEFIVWVLPNVSVDQTVALCVVDQRQGKKTCVEYTIVWLCNLVMHAIANFVWQDTWHGAGSDGE